jgi:uncharacterized delta-60 repeat protein
LDTATTTYTEKITGIAMQNGKVVEVGTLTTTTGGTSTTSLLVARFNTKGVNDVSFGSGGRTTIPVTSGGVAYDVAAADIVVDSSGNIDVLGTATPQSGGNRQFVVAQLNSSGALNTSFGQSGTGFQLISFGSNDDATAAALALGPDGKIVAVGPDSTAADTNGLAVGIARLNTNGSLDTTFNTTGTQTVGFSAVVGGPASANDDGVNSVVVQNDGKIVVVGNAGTQASGMTLFDAAVARLNVAGQLDTSFNGSGEVAYSYKVGGTAMEEARDVTLQGTGLGTQQIVIAGTSGDGRDTAITVTRLTSSGSFDSTFNGSGKFQLSVNEQGHLFGTSATTISTLSDGSLLVGGTAQPQNAVNTYAGGLLLNLTSTGGRNTAFGTNGVALLPGSLDSRVVAQSDGKFLYLSGNNVVRTTAPTPAVVTTTIIMTGHGKKAKAAGVTITFNTTLNPTLASNIKIYTLRAGKGKKTFKIKKQLTYNPANSTLTIPFNKTPVGKGFILLIAPGGIVGTDGEVLANTTIVIPPK